MVQFFFFGVLGAISVTFNESELMEDTKIEPKGFELDLDSFSDSKYCGTKQKSAFFLLLFALTLMDVPFNTNQRDFQFFTLPPCFHK